MNNVGIMLQAQGKFSHAKPFLRRALLEGLERTLGGDHPHTCGVSNSLEKREKEK